MTMQEVYQAVEIARRKLLNYSWTSEEARRDCWEAEEELYKLEEDLLTATDEREVVNETPTVL